MNPQVFGCQASWTTSDSKGLLRTLGANIRAVLRLYRDNGKEHGNYYNSLYRGYRECIGVILGYWVEERKPCATRFAMYRGIAAHWGYE